MTVCVLNTTVLNILTCILNYVIVIKLLLN